MNNNVSMSIKKFLLNKNTVTILGVALMGVVLYVGYTFRIKSLTDPIAIPYALETLTPGTLITGDKIGIMNVPKAALKGSVILNQSQVVGKYVYSDTVIPEGSMFYSRNVVTKEQLPNVDALDYEAGHVLVNMDVTTATTYGNMIMPGSYIDIYLKIQYSGDTVTGDDGNKITVGKLLNNIKVLKVVDSSGNNVFDDLENKRTPSQIIFAVPPEYHILLRKTMYLRTYQATIIPVPIKNTTNEELQVTVSSQELVDFINSITAWTGDGSNSGELQIPEINTQQ